MTIEKKMPNIGGFGAKKPDDDKNNSQNEPNLEPTDVNKPQDVDKSENNSENNKVKSSQNDVDVAELQKQIEELTQKNSELEKKLIYLAAEYDNLKKRSAREIDDARKFSIGKFAIDAFDIYDVLTSALNNTDEKNTDKTLFDGVKMTLSSFDRLFERVEIKQVNPEIGSMFNHANQEAISRVPDELGVGCIVKVVRVGYELNGRLLRPAMVVVSSGK